jgi:hypothetical protein
MAIAEPLIHRSQTNPIASTVGPAFLKFMGSLWSIPEVRRTAYSLTPTSAVIWVLLSQDDREAFRRAVLAEHEFRQDPHAAPVEVQFFTVDEFREDLELV